MRAIAAAVVALALMARAAPAMAEPTRLVTDGSSGGAAPSTAQGAQSTMSSASEPSLNDERVRLPPMAIPQDARSNDRRTAYLGAGVVVLAVMFWWNRRRRDRFEREDRGAPARVAARDDDDDADDLHAAARSDTEQRLDRKHRPDRRDP